MSFRSKLGRLNGWLYAAAFVFLVFAVGMFIMIDGCVGSKRTDCQPMFEYSMNVEVLAVFAAFTWPIAGILLVIGVIVQTVRNHRSRSRASQERREP